MDLMFMLVPLIFFVVIFVFVITFIVIIFRMISGVRKRGVSSVPIGQMMQYTAQAAQAMQENAPRSLNGADAIYLPQIYADLPDFNAALAETYVKQRLELELASKEALKIHNIVISGYDRARTEKTVIYQAALEYREGGTLLQKRYCLHYTYLLPQNEGSTVAANCPNCGAPVSAHDQVKCAYCDSVLANVLGNSWQFTEVYEK